MTSIRHRHLRSLTTDPPPLHNGDRLSRPEFERRYKAMAELKQAELIEGVVYMASPLRFESHAEPHGDLIGWLWTYKIATPGTRLGDNPTVRLDLDNEPQPDALLMIDPDRGGSASLGEEGYIEGPPELVVEVAASSASIDLGDKKRIYRRNGVQEYIVWQIFDNQIEWFQLINGDSVSLEPDGSGVICSSVFPGLWLDTGAMTQGDLQKVLMVLQRGLASADHQTFVDRFTRGLED